MSNYPNMSYCAFENTAAAMDQLAEMLDNAVQNNEPLDLNQYELRHYREMHEKCRALMELLEQHEDMVEEVNRKDDEDQPEEDMVDNFNWVGSRHHY
jgi:hypothetical protein